MAGGGGGEGGQRTPGGPIVVRVEIVDTGAALGTDQQTVTAHSGLIGHHRQGVGRAGEVRETGNRGRGRPAGAAVFGKVDIVLVISLVALPDHKLFGAGTGDEGGVVVAVAGAETNRIIPTIPSYA